MILTALALAGAISREAALPARAQPVEALAGRASPATRPSTDSERTEEAVDDIASASGLAGEVLVAKGGKVLLHRGYGVVTPGGKAKHRAGQRWRLASITKQATAVAIMRMVARGELALDAPIATIQWLTPRMLLTHHTGLSNPDDTTKNGAGVPSFYTAAQADLGYCLSTPAKPGTAFSYNNCDYLLAGALLEQAEGHEGALDNTFWPGDFATPKSQALSVPGFVGGKPEPVLNLATFGTAGALIGTVRSVFEFDRSLMTGKLLSPAQLAELWKPEGKGSYQALGQWVFPGQLKDCAKPKRIVQRDGEIGGVQTRNFILPDDDLVVIVFTNRSSDDFQFGEIWQGKGFAYDLLSAVACS